MDVLFTLLVFGTLGVVLFASAADTVLARAPQWLAYCRGVVQGLRPPDRLLAKLVLENSNSTMAMPKTIAQNAAEHVNFDTGEAGDWQEPWQQETVETFSSTVTKGELLHQLKLGIREAEIFKLYWDERGSKACGMPKYIAALDTIAGVRAECLNRYCKPG